MTQTKDTGKKYHEKATGLALQTAERHRACEHGHRAVRKLFLSLRAACLGTGYIDLHSLPTIDQIDWVQVAFEYLGIDYQYDEVDPYEKPADLLEVSPKGLVPGLRLNAYDPPRALNESTVILEYLEELAANETGRSLLPPLSDPYARALVRLQADHVSRTLVPAFYRFLQAQDIDRQIEHGKEFHAALEDLVKILERTERETPSESQPALGLWKEGGDLGWTDALAGPWLFRATNVLHEYRGFEMPQGTRFRAWLERLFAHPAFAQTCSTRELYIDSYERYAFNRPNTSQVANAINAGRGLP
ncbi:glutathione S-transferase C-terminal-like protein [Punctularia strigosozonata HHB-11173 SS5]|uniref:glutathione S-transferase C-terminal-like protein n=1 Tax=Punctularia strigosozonata (strain HHB-11173) TaxID=741275 RepID=UPI0004417F7B|nr:glutathione S-transferase C-terminal-like protein [Punctularia strigosozonata HHB-11173 SS5]EIN09107.1 glutathione S-transferase C-terminal-like protein [Punctularia strigosozonata HHB-11173 SS5]